MERKSVIQMKEEAVKDALKRNLNNAAGAEYVKETHGISMSKSYYAVIKSKLKNCCKSVERDASGYSLDDIRSMNELLGRLTLEQTKELADTLAKNAR